MGRPTRRCDAASAKDNPSHGPRQGDPAYVHDEEKDHIRFRDGRFAFSREHADWALLRKRERLKGW